MTPQNRVTVQTDLDTQVLSDFIYELNIARRQLSLYPPGHPLISSSNDTALKMLNKLCEFRDTITFGVAPDALFFEKEWLDRKNPVYRDFARFLARFGIASISFQRGLTNNELIRFNQLLCNSRRAIEKCGGFQSLLPTEQIIHIAVTPIDYSLFQSSELGNDSSADRLSTEYLWEDFLQGLLEDRLEPHGEASGARRFDPAAIAEILNQRPEEENGTALDYDRAISTFVSQLKTGERSAVSEHPAQQLGMLLQQLNPELRHQFLGSTFRALDRHPESAPDLLRNFPPELLVETLEQWNKRRLNISSRLIDLLGHFSTTPPTPTDHLVRIKAEPLPDDILQARMEILFVDDDYDCYLPISYQEALQSILKGKIQGTVPNEIAAKLKSSLEKQSIERQCCAVIFNILKNKVDTEIGLELQENLMELSRYFLDTGDFIALKEIYSRWSRYLYLTRADVRFLDEKVLATQTREAFMEEVLDGVELWGQEKYDEICDYIAEVGEPYAELLVERLGNEPQMVLRRAWMKLLIEIGDKATHIVTKALQDERWYLVRNLLIVLGKQRDRLPAKEILQLARHEHPKVRQEALRILFRINPPTADRLLLEELDSNDPQVLLAAIQVAELSRDPAVLDRLHQLLTSEKLGHHEFELKKQLLSTLAGIRSVETLPTLQQILQKKGLILSRRTRDLQMEIIRTLGNYPRTVVEPLLRTLIDSRNDQQANLAAEQIRLLTRTVS